MQLESRFLARCALDGGPNIPRTPPRISFRNPGHRRRRCRFECEFVDDSSAPSARVNDEVLTVDEPPQVNPRLGGPEPEPLSNLSTGEAHVGRVDAASSRRLPHHPFEQGEGAPGRRREIVRSKGHDGGGESVGDPEVGLRDLDVLDGDAASLGGLHGPLVLVQERDRLDEPEILPVVPSSAHPVVGERERINEGVHYRQGAQEPLRVPMKVKDSFTLPSGEEAVEGLGVTLTLVDGPSLFGPPRGRSPSS